MSFNEDQTKSANSGELEELKDKLRRRELEMVSLIRATEAVRLEAEHLLAQESTIKKLSQTSTIDSAESYSTNLLEQGRLYDDREVANIINVISQIYDRKIARLIEVAMSSKNIFGRNTVSRKSMARWLKYSGVFDREYYLSSNEDVKEQGADPLLHYINYGSKEGRRPGPLFK
ncbi:MULTISPECIES: hypothetical protein [unclassified Methylobacterium]